ncbi:uncharacterized protein MYCFIDRAFT_174515 [Pseudocercospora fijiensis CIRAD86]|uniref:Uncharacterized protein n=1 Tax=Pseudocercospora fijiensis (strain CIRAD86) TaxID=383855 RepID=M3AEJ1_PSEFD|nr:uncharacterized protein MYCFIDRAFT_174515 [Pseudocercospora fijiensis CIRAD86]EME83021.1 hypothetical protein MYCFIDRAFT_174515 [Pseudocercospora fijiensis CIRAD86]
MVFLRYDGMWNMIYENFCLPEILIVQKVEQTLDNRSPKARMSFTAHSSNMNFHCRQKLKVGLSRLVDIGSGSIYLHTRMNGRPLENHSWLNDLAGKSPDLVQCMHAPLNEYFCSLDPDYPFMFSAFSLLLFIVN